MTMSSTIVSRPNVVAGYTSDQTRSAGAVAGRTPDGGAGFAAALKGANGSAAAAGGINAEGDRFVAAAGSNQNGAFSYGRVSQDGTTKASLSVVGPDGEPLLLREVDITKGSSYHASMALADGRALDVRVENNQIMLNALDASGNPWSKTIDIPPRPMPTSIKV
jgi:hypothetical protein